LDVSGNCRIQGNQYLTGNVGIGKINPTCPLDIQDTNNVTGAGLGKGIVEIRGGIGTGKYNHGKQGIYVAHVNGSQGVSIGFAGVAQTGSSTVPLVLYGRSSEIIHVVDNNNVTQFISYSNGNIGYNGNPQNISDERIKENIREVDDNEALNKILALQPKKYEYIDKEQKGDKPHTVV
jgi:hypothetical protein